MLCMECNGIWSMTRCYVAKRTVKIIKHEKRKGLFN